MQVVHELMPCALLRPTPSPPMAARHQRWRVPRIPAPDGARVRWEVYDQLGQLAFAAEAVDGPPDGILRCRAPMPEARGMCGGPVRKAPAGSR